MIFLFAANNYIIRHPYLTTKVSTMAWKSQLILTCTKILIASCSELVCNHDSSDFSEEPH